jgi:TolB protein
MKNSKSTLTLKTLKKINLLIPLLLVCLFPGLGEARIFIDINSPSVQKIKIAIPDFRDTSQSQERPDLSAALPGVISNDLDLSGYFIPMDKTAFLEENKAAFTVDEIQFRDWSTIGADLLLKGSYTSIGQSVEAEVRLFDVLRGRQILGKRILGRADDHRALMHRISNDIIYLLTGQKGMFLSKIAFVGTATGNKEIYICDYDGYNVKQVTHDKSIALMPRWSPQGDKIFYNSYKDGEGPALYLMDVASGRSTRVSARKGLNTGAAWAPDGQSVALTLNVGDNMDIHRIDLSGKIMDRLTNYWGINVSPTFSPDGTKVAFVSNRSGGPQIYVKDLANGREERISFEGKYNTSPFWSSLNKIAYTGMDEGRFNIFTIDPDGRGLRQLTAGQGNNEDPCWYVNGRHLMFSSNREGGFHVYLMNANGQNQRRITNFKGEQTSPSWSP